VSSRIEPITKLRIISASQRIVRIQNCGVPL
jgi:hypothetical protein